MLTSNKNRPQNRFQSWPVVTLLLLILTIGCAGSIRPAGICLNQQIPDPEPGQLNDLLTKVDVAWSKRSNEEQLVKAISLLRRSVKVAPRRLAIYLHLSNALYLWADGALRFRDDEEAMSAAFKEATDVAELALAISNPVFQKIVCRSEDFTRAVEELKKQDVPYLYAYTTALGKYGLVQSVLVVLEHQSKIKQLMERAHALWPNFHYGAADRYFGVYFSKIPFPTGDLERSRQHFKKSLQRAPDLLATRVLMAEFLAPKLQDRAMFEEQLTYVMNRPANVILGMTAETLVEQEKARRLLAEVEQIFPPETDPRKSALKRDGWYFEAPDSEDKSGAIEGHTLRLIRTGEQMDDERWRLVKQAKRSLYISAYAWKNDNVGLALVKAVCNRIRRSNGKLEVKILLENYGSKELLTGNAKQLRAGGELFASKAAPKGALMLRKCGASIIFYRPRREGLQNLMQVRHEKLFIVDGHTMLTGGSNIGDHYHMASPRSGKWYDLDLFVKGPLACWYHNQFQKSWQRVVSQDMGIELDGLSEGSTLRGFREATRNRIYGLDRMEICDRSSTKISGPSHLYGIMGRPMSSDRRPILESYLRSIQEAKESIRLYAPYFVPAHKLSKALIAAQNRGVKVTIITNSPESLDESNLIFSAMLLSVFHPFKAGSIISNGIDLRIWTRKATLHRKGGIFDAGRPNTQKMFMGSDNLDVRGQEYSSESIVWTDDPKMIAELTHDFSLDIKSSKALDTAYKDEYLAIERRSFVGRCKLWIAENMRTFF